MGQHYKTALMLVLICACTAAVGLSDKQAILSRMGILSLLNYIGATADAGLQAQIADLADQMETLQKMVTLLIPEQEQRIISQQKVQMEQQKEIQKQVEERLRQEEENKLLMEKEKKEELEKEKQLLQEKQMEVDQLNQEKQDQERQDVEEEDGEKRTSVESEEKTCPKVETYCEHVVCSETPMYTAPVLTETASKGDDTQDELTQMEEQSTRLLKSFEDEKLQLRAEMKTWQLSYKSETARANRRSKTHRLLVDVEEKEKKDAEEREAAGQATDTLSQRIEGIVEENNALRASIEELQASYNEKLSVLLDQLEDLKSKIVELDSTEHEVGVSAEEVQSLVGRALSLFSADRVGMPDYALESAGAVVFTIGETEPYTRDTPWMGIFGIPIWRSCKTPRLAIQMDNSAGNCWSFTGTKGSLTIQLAAQVFPEHFTIDHIPASLAPHGNASSAPYHFRVLGLDYGNAPKGHVLGNYEFTELPIQTFAIQQNPYEKFFRFIKIEILSNHGNNEYTCLYRFRVHGIPQGTNTFNG